MEDKRKIVLSDLFGSIKESVLMDFHIFLYYCWGRRLKREKLWNRG